MKETILFIYNEMPESGICGISIFGMSYSKAMMLTEKYNVLRFCANSGQEVIDLYNQYKPKLIFYAFCIRTTPWMAEIAWKKRIPCKHIVIDADITQRAIDTFHPSTFYGFDAYVCHDPTLDVDFRDNVYKVSHIRPDVVAPEYVDTGITKIGFHGSATFNKGILELVDYVQQNYDEAELRFHCPLNYTYSGNSNKDLMNNIEIVKSKISKPGIKFFLTTDIVSDQELVNRISQNTVNCYFNREDPYGTPVSSIHTALSARRPIAIRKTKPTVSYWQPKPSICIEDNSIKDIIKNGFEPLEFLYEKYSPANICKEFESIIGKLLKPKGMSFSL
jgi:hypothetical protein